MHLLATHKLSHPENSQQKYLHCSHGQEPSVQNFTSMRQPIPLNNLRAVLPLIEMSPTPLHRPIINSCDFTFADYDVAFLCVSRYGFALIYKRPLVPLLSSPITLFRLQITIQLAMNIENWRCTELNEITYSCTMYIIT